MSGEWQLAGKRGVESGWAERPAPMEDGLTNEFGRERGRRRRFEALHMRLRRLGVCGRGGPAMMRLGVARVWVDGLGREGRVG